MSLKCSQSTSSPFVALQHRLTPCSVLRSQDYFLPFSPLSLLVLNIHALSPSSFLSFCRIPACSPSILSCPAFAFHQWFSKLGPGSPRGPWGGSRGSGCVWMPWMCVFFVFDFQPLSLLVPGSPHKTTHFSTTLLARSPMTECARIAILIKGFTLQCCFLKCSRQL